MKDEVFESDHELHLFSNTNTFEEDLITWVFLKLGIEPKWSAAEYRLITFCGIPIPKMSDRLENLIIISYLKHCCFEHGILKEQLVVALREVSLEAKELSLIEDRKINGGDGLAKSPSMKESTAEVQQPPRHR